MPQLPPAASTTSIGLARATKQATAIQDWHIVNKVVESMRSIDTRDEATALARVGGFAGPLGTIPIWVPSS